MAEKFPGWRYDPATGEGGLFNSADEVPDGWLDHVPPPGAPLAQEPAVSVRKPMTRAEITAALDSGRISYDPKAKADELHALLRDKVIAALKARAIAFDEAADTRDLLALLGT